jgi:hypothetical protein
MTVEENKKEIENFSIERLEYNIEKIKEEVKFTPSMFLSSNVKFDLESTLILLEYIKRMKG